MNELKEIYGIELTNRDKLAIIVDILYDKYLTINESLSLTTDLILRENCLKKIEAIKYILNLIGEICEDS